MTVCWGVSTVQTLALEWSGMPCMEEHLQESYWNLNVFTISVLLYYNLSLSQLLLTTTTLKKKLCFVEPDFLVK